MSEDASEIAKWKAAFDEQFKRRSAESAARLKAEQACNEANMELVMLRALVADAEKRLDMAAIQFQGYAEHHRAKSPPDEIKAHRNEEMAALCNGKAALGMPERPKRITEPQRAKTFGE